MSMLNILKLKLKNSYNNIAINPKHRNKSPFNFVPVVRDWKNSIYTYNKRSLSNTIEANNLINKLIKGYFRLCNIKLEKKAVNKKIGNKKAITKVMRKKLISKNKIFTSIGQFKHTSDLINITIFFYNRELITYMYILAKKYIKLLKNKNYIINKKLSLIKSLGLKIYKRESEIKSLLIKTLNNKEKLNNINLVLYKVFIKKSLFKEFLYLYLNVLIFMNKSKFNNYYLHNLINLIKKIYKKNIKFNFINLKNHYLNSDIFTETLLLKLSVIKKRVLKSLRRSIRKAKILEQKKEIINSKYLKGLILDNIKYKKISGVRLEVSGRLTRRYTAARSISKLKYKGSLANINSSQYQVSSALIRGKFQPNLEYTKLQSKARIGAFGIKGWISGM